MEVIQPYLLGWLVPTVLAAIAGYLGGKVNGMAARDKAMERGMCVLLRGEITRAYQRHVIDQRPMTLECRRQIDEIWKAYHDLGGNGAGEAMYRELCELTIGEIK